MAGESGEVWHGPKVIGTELQPQISQISQITNGSSQGDQLFGATHKNNLMLWELLKGPRATDNQRNLRNLRLQLQLQCQMRLQLLLLQSRLLLQLRSQGLAFSMPPLAVLEVNPDLSIPLSELEYRATRSGGPGGQHVNTSASRIEVVWDIASSRVLSDEQRSRLLARLGTRLDSEGKLRLVASDRRSQLQNKEAVTERLRDVVARALVVPKKRKKSTVPRAEKARRLEAKRRRGEIKAKRRPVKGDE